MEILEIQTQNFVDSMGIWGQIGNRGEKMDCAGQSMPYTLKQDSCWLSKPLYHCELWISTGRCMPVNMKMTCCLTLFSKISLISQWKNNLQIESLSLYVKPNINILIQTYELLWDLYVLFYMIVYYTILNYVISICSAANIIICCGKKLQWFH